MFLIMIAHVASMVIREVFILKIRRICQTTKTMSYFLTGTFMSSCCRHKMVK